MKKAIRILALGVAVAASATIAKADTYDQISTAGVDTYTNTTITFDSSYTASGGNGVFSALNGGSVVFNGTMNYTYGSYPPYLVYTITNGSDVLQFFATSNTYSDDIFTVAGTSSETFSLTLNGDGYYTSNYFTGELPGSFTITSQGEPYPNGGVADGTVTFSGTGFAPTISATPEPSSLVLLGSSLLGAAALARRRFAHKLSA